MAKAKNNIEWLQGDKKELDYHIKQYDEPKEYTKLLIKKLKEWNLVKKGNKILDLGSGAGANTYFFAKEFPKAKFEGVDINPEYIRIANGKKLPNTSFFTGDITNLKIKPHEYNGLLSIQTISWMDSYKKSLKMMFDLKPEWILITSLFYDGPVEAKIQIKDFTRKMADKNYRSTYYNIYSLDRIREFSNKYKFDVAKAEPFIFPFDLPMPQNKEMATYTKLLTDGTRIQISGPLLMTWHTVLITQQL